jgi:uncharacterized protein YlzI (FlbEa/FlbD family)
MRLIKLHFASSGDEVFVNPDHIQWLLQTESGTNMRLEDSKELYLIEETPEQINKIISYGL